MKDIVKKLSHQMLDHIKENKLDNKQFLDLVEEAKLKALEQIVGQGQFVLKKGGYTEVFSKEKLFYSIISAADSINEPITRSDANIIIDDVDEAMESRSIISTDEIRKIVKGSLVKNGFSNVSRAYR